MLFDFSKTDLTDEQKTVLSDAAVQSALSASYKVYEENTVSLWKEQLEAEKTKVSEFRENNIALTKKQEALTQQLDDAKSGNNTAEVDRLTRELADASAKYESVNGQVSQFQEQIADYERSNQQRIVIDQVTSAITKHNKEFPNARIRDDQGAREFLVDKALKVFKANEDSSVTAFNEKGEPIGNLDPAAWINTSFRESNSFCFETATGGGAAGGQGSGGAGFNAKDLAGNEAARTSAINAKFPELAQG